MFKTMDSQWWAHLQNNVLVLGMMGRVQNDGLALMMGLHSKQWAHIQNGGAVFQAIGLHLKCEVVFETMGWVGNGRLAFEAVGSGLKQQDWAQNGGLVFEAMGLSSKQWAHI